MSRNHFAKHLPGLCCFQGTAAPVFGKCDQGFPQCPTPSAGPGAGIERKGGAKGFAAFPREKRPRNRYITGRIAHPRRPEIDDSTQSASRDQLISCTDIAMQPDGSAAPSCPTLKSRRLDRSSPPVLGLLDASARHRSPATHPDRSYAVQAQVHLPDRSGAEREGTLRACSQIGADRRCVRWSRPDLRGHR
jgi:hypothetical protein